MPKRGENLFPATGYILKRNGLISYCGCFNASLKESSLGRWVLAKRTSWENFPCMIVFMFLQVFSFCWKVLGLCNWRAFPLIVKASVSWDNNLNPIENNTVCSRRAVLLNVRACALRGHRHETRISDSQIQFRVETEKKWCFFLSSISHFKTRTIIEINTILSHSSSREREIENHFSWWGVKKIRQILARIPGI